MLEQKRLIFCAKNKCWRMHSVSRTKWHFQVCNALCRIAVISLMSGNSQESSSNAHLLVNWKPNVFVGTEANRKSHWIDTMIYSIRQRNGFNLSPKLHGQIDFHVLCFAEHISFCHRHHHLTNQSEPISSERNETEPIDTRSVQLLTVHTLMMSLVCLPCAQCRLFRLSI